MWIDSTGICIYDSNRIQTVRTVGKERGVIYIARYKLLIQPN